MKEELVEEWVAKAEMDFESALDLSRRRAHPLPDKVAYDCAQCAEKYLKAFLKRNQRSFRRHHDLIKLKESCFELDSGFQVIHDTLTILNQWSSDVRYPGVSAGIEDADEAVKAVKRVRKFIRAKLELEGSMR